MFKSFIAITALFAGLAVFQTPAQAYCAANDEACWQRADQRQMQRQLNEMRIEEQRRNNVGHPSSCLYTFCY